MVFLVARYSAQCHLMAMAMVLIEIAQELLSLAEVDTAQASHAAAQLIALELFREGRISLGRAAQLAGSTVEDFMDFSARREVPLHYAEAELAEDHAIASRLKL